MSSCFIAGIRKVFETHFVKGRAGKFLAREDPVYVSLLSGMGDEAFAKAFVTNWAIAHTLATQSRFWLEEAIVDLLMRRAELGSGLQPRIYSLRMLAQGWYSSGRSVWDVGEKWREELHGSGTWRPPLHESTLDEIERIVGEEDRRYDAAHTTPNAPGATALTEGDDEATLNRVATTMRGTPTPTALRCNLLFIEPELPGGGAHAWGIRYINPSTFAQPSMMKGERANLLRLYAFLVQEKPFRDPKRIKVVAADLVPRHERFDYGREAFHFSEHTRWRAPSLWQFLGVPFDAVTAGIRDAGATMRGELVAELGRVLSRDP